MDNKEEKQLRKSFIIFSAGLTICACTLILAGIFIEYILGFYHISLNSNLIWVIKILLIFLGAFHFWLIKYSHNTLKDLFQGKK